MSHQYILHIQMFRYVGEKRMVGFIGSSSDLYLNWKMPIKFVEAGPQKVVKPVFQIMENLSKTIKAKDSLKSCVLKREGYWSDII